MNPYRLLSLFLLLWCQYPSFAAPADSTNLIDVDVEVIARDESVRLVNPNFKGECYYIVINLTNNRDTAVTFQVMTCSWDESFLFNTDSLRLPTRECNSNIAETIRLLPHQSKRFYSKMYSRVTHNDYQQPFKFKIGFIDLSYLYYDSFPHSLETRKNSKTYWSKDVLLVPEIN